MESRRGPPKGPRWRQSSLRVPCRRSSRWSSAKAVATSTEAWSTTPRCRWRSQQVRGGFTSSCAAASTPVRSTLADRMRPCWSRSGCRYERDFAGTSPLSLLTSKSSYWSSPASRRSCGRTSRTPRGCSSGATWQRGALWTRGSCSTGSRGRLLNEAGRARPRDGGHARADDRRSREESLVQTFRPDSLSRKGLSRNVPEGFGWLPGGGGLGLGACWRSGVSRRQIGRCAEEVLAVVDQLGDALTDVVECAVRGQLLGTCRIQVVVPALAELLQGGHVDGAVVEVLVEGRHVVPQETTVHRDRIPAQWYRACRGDV